MRGQLIKRGSDTWLIRVYAGSVGGKRRYVNKTVHGTKADAQRELTRMLGQKDTEELPLDGRLTTEAYLQEWLAGRVGVTSRTLADYRYLMRSWVVPVLGQVPVAKLSPLHVQRVVAGMLAAQVSPRMVRKTITVLGSALQRAVESRLLASNPCRRTKVDLPQVKQRSAGRPLTTEEMDRLVSASQTHPLGALWLTLLGTGLRTQEALALTWADLDLDQGTLRVERAVTVDITVDAEGKERYRQIVADPKTVESRRVLSLPASTVATLREHRRTVASRSLALVRPEAPVFGTRTGKHLALTNVNQVWRTFRTSLGLSCRLYDLRHTHATHLLQATGNLKLVSRRLGHSSIQVTADVYSHVLPQMDAEAAQQFDRLVTKASGE